VEPALSDRAQRQSGTVAGGAAARAGGGADKTRRLCLWLAEQSACDRGLVGRLVKAHGSFAEVVAQPRSALVGAVRVGAGADRGAPPASGEPADGHEAVVAWCDDDYPPGLRELFDPPPALFVRGHRWRAMLRGIRLRPSVAIVGARRPSPYGLEMAWLLGAGLARAGVNVVSGMALGIDAQAHVGALADLGQADTDGEARDEPVVLAGVLGAGVRLAVPRTNYELFEAIAQRGLLLSEYGWQLPPAPWRFPARNRLIAALADAVVIVEGGATSGALHTAAFALDLGRDVLAVPGEAGRPLSAGPHRLLRDGAHLCESPDDVLALLPASAWSALTEARAQPGGPSRTSDRDGGAETGAAAHAADQTTRGSSGARSGPERRVLAALQRGQHTADQLGRTLALAPEAVSAALTMLEIDGLLEVGFGGRYGLRRGARRSPAP
jgi:DNA protecting protein DprA